MTLTTVKMAGNLRSGRDTRGSLIHLVSNPDGRSRSTLGPALCGATPRIDWSGWEPADGSVCPKCAAANAQVSA
jgi:hypothetical protein